MTTKHFTTWECRRFKKYVYFFYEKREDGRLSLRYGCNTKPLTPECSACRSEFVKQFDKDNSGMPHKEWEQKGPHFS